MQVTDLQDPPLEICQHARPDASVIWLHGLGADGHDLAPLVNQLALQQPIRHVFPHAPQRSVSLNGGLTMRAWYDIVSLESGAAQDAAGLAAACVMVRGLIQQEVRRGIPASRILLVGFSQGGALALHAGLRHAAALGGIVALSAYLPLHETLAEERNPANANTPLLWAHGSQDEVIPIQIGRNSAAWLTGLGYPLAWHQYAMAHSICTEEIAELRRFLLQCLLRYPGVAG